MKTVLVTGSFGYIGNALTQRLLTQGYTVVGIDNNIKSCWLADVKETSAMPFTIGFERVKQLKELGKYTHYTLDISQETNRLKEIFRKYDFDTIVNLAQMPSAPYSMIGLDRASWTIQNNTIGSLNIIYMVRDHCPDAQIVEIESLGTVNPSINILIDEGRIQFTYKGRKSEPCLFPKQAASQYHNSKVFNTYLLESAERWWGINSTSINQGVVYGLKTPEMDQSKLYSHFAYGTNFGTVTNRFIVQSLIGKPLTIYGEGNQKRGYLTLNDSVQCLMLFIENPAKGFRLVNQLADVYSINDIANKIKEINPKTEFKYMDTPRVEITDDFYYNVKTDVLKKLGFKNTGKIEEELEYLYNLIDVNNINKEDETFVKW